MKILFFIDSLISGGKERQLYYLLKKICTNNNIMLVVFNDEVFYKEIFDLPIQIRIIPRSEKYTLKTIKTLYSVCNRFNPELIHSWDNIGTLLIMTYLLLHPKVKLVSSIRYAGKIKRNLLHKTIQKIVFKRSSLIISNSTCGIKVEQLFDHKKGYVIYNGIDLQDFVLISSEVSSNISEFESFQTKIVMLASFTAAKDYITYIRIAKKIISKYPTCCFLCVGDGPNRKEAELETGEYLNKNIFFLGVRRDIPAILKQMDIGILFNNTNGHAEGISNAVMEYMAAGLPVIATNAGGTPEIVKDEESGFLVPAFDEKIVSEKIEYLIENPEEAQKLGTEGRKIIEKDFSIKKMTSEYCKLYVKLTNERQ